MVRQHNDHRITEENTLVKRFLKIFAKFRGKQPCPSLFKIKLQALGLQLSCKIDSRIYFFMKILRNCCGQHFYCTPVSGCFWFESYFRSLQRNFISSLLLIRIYYIALPLRWNSYYNTFVTSAAELHSKSGAVM